ncbi:MAG: AMP-binding protein, partial [Clostridia bacterium]|nr:AMP-binding protein [Clostridia bacterium]
NMQYTSGTTGFPKGVMLTHYNILNNGKTIGDGMAFTPDDKLCIVVPLFHCFGLVLATMACITHGSTLVPVERFSPVPVMNAIATEHCTAVHGVPTMFIAMLEHPDFDQFDFSSLRTGIMAGSPCPIEVMKKVVDKMYMKDIVIVFGQTEASPGCTMTTTSDDIEHSVATVVRAFPGVECKIVDPETGEEKKAGEPGEFVARGYNIMKGYYKMPEATKQAIDEDGWLHTGDLCTVDADGYYKVVGRIKDMIIRGGENIYPKEIEEFLYTCDKIRDVQVIGVPSKKYGEEVMACIILKPGETMTEDEVKELVKANMAYHKVPSYVRFVTEFPMNAAGKIQKYKMREEAIEILKLHEAASIETA